MTSGERLFGIVPTDAARPEFGLSKNALRLLIELASYADSKTRIARPGQERLAIMLGWCNQRTGEPDRRRVYRAMKELLDVDLVRIAGQHPLGDGQWVRMYLVAPFSDAHEGDASSRGHPNDAQEGRASPSTAADTMRMFLEADAHVSRHDAHVVHAPSYQSLLQTSSSSDQSLKPAHSTKKRVERRDDRTPEEKRKLGRTPEFERLVEDQPLAEGQGRA